MIQSLSIVVPNRKCINNCAFCVSKMYPDEYRNQMDENLPFFDLYFKDYLTLPTVKVGGFSVQRASLASKVLQFSPSVRFGRVPPYR